MSSRSFGRSTRSGGGCRRFSPRIRATTRIATRVIRPADRRLLEKVDPLAFLVGPVKVHYDAKPAKAKVVDLGQFIDHKAKVVRSNTGQIRLDYGRGVCTIDSPCAAGASGFLKKRGVVETSSVTIDSQNEYASVLVVSLDGEPLARSRKVLVQVGTQARPTGWVEREATFKSDDGKQTFQGKQVVSTGAMPWAV